MIPPRSHRHLLVQGGTLVTMDPARRVLPGDLLVTDGEIVDVGESITAPPGTRLLDATGLYVFPGFIQGHLHLGQSLFRGLAEGRALLPWLRERIWPLEAAHTEESAYWSGMLGAADCLLAGTTTIQDIGLARGMRGILRAIVDSGLRGVAGKCLMDDGDDVPPALRERTRDALAGAEALLDEFADAGRGRLTGAVCPRFILSCSDALWEGTVDLARRRGLPVHTHLLESADEEIAVREVKGTSQMEYLHGLGVLDTDLRIAHGVWLEEDALAVLDGRALSVVHCPSANLKLGSGIADVVYLRRQPNVAVGIGCDGAGCNNDHDVLDEMRLAGLLASVKREPGALDARSVLELATIEGARALGARDRLGSLEPGKCGDLVVLDLHRPATFGATEVSVYDRVVYAAGRDSVRWVVVDGEVLVESGELRNRDLDEIHRRAREEIDALIGRADLS